MWEYKVGILSEISGGGLRKATQSMWNHNYDTKSFGGNGENKCAKQNKLCLEKKLQRVVTKMQNETSFEMLAASQL